MPGSNSEHTVIEDETELPLSELLREFAEGPDMSVTIGEMTDGFGRRVFGALLFVFAAPNLLPLPPGSSSILGLPLVIAAPQVAIGHKALWLPRRVRDRVVPKPALAKTFQRLSGLLRRIEKVSTARWSFMFGPVGDRVIGLVCSLMALILILPIPLGNMLPALAIATLAISMVQRDGIIALIGHGLATISCTVLILTGQVAVAALGRLLDSIGFCPAFLCGGA